MNSKGLNVNLELDRPQYRAVGRLGFQFTITNESDERMHVLKWHTPFEGFNSDMFRVVKARKRAIYLGRTVKRGLPRREDYISLEPGASVSKEFDLAEVYDISKPGDYIVNFGPALLDFGPEEPEDLAAKRLFVPRTVRSKGIRFKLVEEREPRQIDGVALKWLEEQKKKEKKPEAKKLPTFEDCSQSERNKLNSALSKAKRIAARAQLDLSHTLGNERLVARRFRTWFGNYASTQYSKVITSFGKITNALVNKEITFNCDCDENYVAYVYATRPYEIYLCNAFWVAPLIGEDSQAGTIVHEVSHFNVVAGTDDHVYGQPGCRQLAIDDASKAIDNADSYEYFAENDPALSMGMGAARYALWMLDL